MDEMTVEIDKSSPVPIYHQIEEALREIILSGNLEPNERLPSGNELSDRYGISPMTVRQAMSGLVRDGLIYRKRGRGTFVAPRKMEHPLLRMTSFTEDMRARGLDPGSRLLRLEKIPAPQEVAEALGIEAGEPVTRVKRLRLADGHRVGVHDAYLRGPLDISPEVLEAEGSLYRLLDTKDISLVEGKDVIEAIEATEEHSELLNIPVGTALLQVTRTAIDRRGQAMEHVIACYRADLYRYTIQLKR